MGYTGEPGCDEERATLIPKGAGAMWIHGGGGALLFASFWLIPVWERGALGLRAVVATAHLRLFARIARPVRKKTALIYFFTLSLWMIPAGLWLAFIVPRFRIAALHLVFIGGFSLMIFSFGQLVVLSHSRHAALLNGRLIPLKIVGVAVVLAALLRTTADFWSNAYMMLIHISSGLWVLAAGYWLFDLRKKMFGSAAPEH
jgi:uncharacterized protein involved in response to NO